MRSEAVKEQIARKESRRNEREDDGSILIRISGCEYKVSAERLKSSLAYWGEVMTDPKEEVFKDPLDPDGTNRTGIYVLRIKLSQEIPELIPLSGLRLKIMHHQVKKLCTRCYEPHLRKNCDGEKKSWFDYVRRFMDENGEIENEFYGGLYERVIRDHKNTRTATRPKPEDYKAAKKPG